MNTMTLRSIKLAPLTATLLAALALGGCNKNDGQTAGQKVDSAIAKTEQAATNAAAEVKHGAEEAKQKAEVAVDKAASATEGAAAAVEAKLDDAGITTAVNAKLAAASDLSALKIDVDTKNGQVTLHGTAPDAAARDHATELAKSVSGVTSVDNKLTIKK